ncbi:MAG: hypothetical protein DWP92_07545 [Armatimonadetes bacterium]|nr:MAG: hypothetical protein DWP92_07545 [Armatimonadota bacterium]
MGEFDWLTSLTQNAELDAKRTERMRASLLDHIANAQLKDDLILLVGDHPPTPLESARMRRRLEDKLKGPETRAAWRRVVGALTAVAAAIILAVIAITTVGTDSAEAVRNVAEAVATIPDEDFTTTEVERRMDQTILIVEPIDTDDSSTTEVAFLLPITEIRRSDPGGSLQKEETTGEPTFFTPVDDASAAIIRSRFLVGETEISTFPPPASSDEAAILTNDPELLADRINETITRFGPPEIPREAQVVSMVASIYTITLPTSSERAALLEVLASTPGLEFPSPQLADTVEVATNYTYDDGTAVRLTIVLDAQGWLVRETETLLDGIEALSVPRGTPVFDRRFTPPDVS